MVFDVPGVSAVVLSGVVASFLAGLCTAAGALPVWIMPGGARAPFGLLLGFAAGVMLAASIFSLLVPALDHAGETWTAGSNVVVVSVSVLAGAAMLFLIHRWVPHRHFVIGREGVPAERLAGIWLFVLAITLHNFPEGLAVGVGFGDSFTNGMSVALGIGIQNLPEGFAVAAALLGEGYGRRTAFNVAALTGLVEPVGGVVGAATVAFASSILPVALAAAAGAMIFVISDEIIPETHRGRTRTGATFALMFGFVLMMGLDVGLS
jgi:ZIP family zinc transporter